MDPDINTEYQYQKYSGYNIQIDDDIRTFRETTVYNRRHKNRCPTDEYCKSDLDDDNALDKIAEVGEVWKDLVLARYNFVLNEVIK